MSTSPKSLSLGAAAKTSFKSGKGAANGPTERTELQRKIDVAHMLHVEKEARGYAAELQNFAAEGDTTQLVYYVGGADKAAGFTGGKLSAEKVSAMQDNVADSYFLLATMGGAHSLALKLSAQDNPKPRADKANAAQKTKTRGPQLTSAPAP